MTSLWTQENCLKMVPNFIVLQNYHVDITYAVNFITFKSDFYQFQ
jgi:hypothetical protein